MNYEYPGYAPPITVASRVPRPKENCELLSSSILIVVSELTATVSGLPYKSEQTLPSSATPLDGFLDLQLLQHFIFKDVHLHCRWRV